MSKADFDSEEQEFRRELEAALAANRAAAGACPKPELLMAAQSGVPLEAAQAIDRHIALCPICQQLSRDLAEHEFPPVSAAEDRRIRARWQSAGTQSAHSWLRSWQMLTLTAVITASVIVMVVVRSTGQAPMAAKIDTRAVRPIPATTGLFTLAKAAIKVPATSVLTFRGDANGGKAYVGDLAAALQPYRADDYTEAARRLESLSRKYPDAAEPLFYGGVSLLFLNQNDAAIRLLETARQDPGDTLRDDIAWYLAVAFDRAGRTADARREAEALCMDPGEYKERACAAANALK